VYRREGTFKLIESGEPFYPRHLSEDSKDFMRKASCLMPSFPALCPPPSAFCTPRSARVCFVISALCTPPPAPPLPHAVSPLSISLLPSDRNCPQTEIALRQTCPQTELALRQNLPSDRNCVMRKARQEALPFAHCLCHGRVCLPFTYCLLPCAVC